MPQGKNPERKKTTCEQYISGVLFVSHRLQVLQSRIHETLIFIEGCRQHGKEDMSRRASWIPIMHLSHNALPSHDASAVCGPSIRVYGMMYDIMLHWYANVALNTKNELSKLKIENRNLSCKGIYNHAKVFMTYFSVYHMNV